MDVDPWRVHAYWNVAETDIAAARAQLPGGGSDSTLVLRFTDLSPRAEDTAPPHERFEIKVKQARDNRYIGLWRDAKHYSAELGLRAPDGAFVAVAGSNEVSTPRGGPSRKLDLRQVEVRSPRSVQSPPAPTGSDQSDALLRDLFPVRVLPSDDYPVAIVEGVGDALDESPFPDLADGARDDGDAGPWSALPPHAAPPGVVFGDAALRAGDFPVVDAAEIDPYRAAAQEAKARLLTGIDAALPPVAEETVSPTDFDLEPQPLPVPEPPADAVRGPVDVAAGAGQVEGPPPDMPGLPVSPAVEWRPRIPLEGVLAGAASSPGLGAFPVQAWADVHIHGWCEPDSPLILFGQPVPVQADGSFSVRLSLGQGPELAALLAHLRNRFGDGGDR